MTEIKTLIKKICITQKNCFDVIYPLISFLKVSHVHLFLLEMKLPTISVKLIIHVEDEKDICRK